MLAYCQQMMFRDFRIPARKTGKYNGSNFEVAIITRNRAQSLQRLLVSLSKQSVKPGRIIIVDNASSDQTKQVVQSFFKYLPTVYLYERKIGIAHCRNRVLDEAKGELLAFLDDDCEAEVMWVEKMIEAHLKYSQAAVIQGRSISLPKGGGYAIITQFIRQSWERANMLGDKKLYWAWLQGRIKKDFRLLSCDTKNLSLKTDFIKRLHCRFDTSFNRGSDVDFGKQVISGNREIIYYPKAMAYHHERDNIGTFLKQRWYQGRTSIKIRFKWPSEYHSRVNPGYLHNLVAFVYYCWKNKYFLQLPQLLPLFLLYLTSHYLGRIYELRYQVSSREEESELTGFIAAN